MNAKVFIDTNIIIYAYSSTEPEKQFIAQKLISGNNACISTQVLTEFCNILLRKFKVESSIVSQALQETTQNLLVFENTKETIQDAIRISNRYDFSFYDSLIISAAISAQCEILYSEDLNCGQIIDGNLKIMNPFKN